MKGMIVLGRASEQTKGNILSSVPVDAAQQKIVENGLRYNSQPTPVNPLTKKQNNF